MFKIQNSKFKIQNLLCLLTFTSLFAISVFAQETPPTPGAPRVAKIPAVIEKKLSNGLTIATVERKNVPLVTVEVLFKSGADSETMDKAGLANLTASMLTKGTKSKTASQIAEQIEFLGGSINTAAGWNNSVVQITVTNDKLDQAMAILSDVVLNPTFKQDELDLLKTQTLDGLSYNLKQPGFLANYVASKYSFKEHPAGGTPESLKALTRENIVKYYNENYIPNEAIIIFSGDMAPAKASALAQSYFGKWKKVNKVNETFKFPNVTKSDNVINRILVVDLPNSGQASVNFTRNLIEISRREGKYFFPGSVMNSVLGGGYSSRLNQEIRIKRGLSYGAGSGFAWRGWKSNFSTRTQTKNESAAEVAQLVETEVKRLIDSDVPQNELSPRKLVLTGDFGRELETTVGLADKVGELFGFNLPLTELNSFMPSVNSISAQQIKDFAAANLKGGDMIIVGDYAVFKDDLAKRFPKMKIEVVKADELDLTTNDLRKAK